MSIRQFFKVKVEEETKESTCFGQVSSLSAKESIVVNEVVEKALNETGKRGKYNKYSPNDRAKIGKYAAENGATKAARHYSKVMGFTINESTARKMKSEYLEKLKAVSGASGHDVVPSVTSLPTKHQGRPLLFGKEIDSAVQNVIEGLRRNKAVVNTRIVMAVGEGVIRARDPVKLHATEHMITKGWAKSILKRMGFSKRKGTNAGKVTVAHFEQVKECFMADITAEVMMKEIPDGLIVNWDQTPLHIVPTGNWTMHRRGEKVIPLSNLDDKRQITAVLAVSINGDYLPPQLIYQGKTIRCHPKVIPPKGWDIWHSENHWSNEETMTRYLQKIIIPYMNVKRQELKLAEDYPALVLFDVFKGQTTPTIERLLQENNISFVLIPPNCTDKLQPLDISINKPMKDALKDQFQMWYAQEVQSQLQDGSELKADDEVKIDTTMTAIKDLSTRWIISAWQSIERRSELAINGFQKSGIRQAVSAARD